ncbi:uncharacterized protein BCR38DRAFT_408829 [Pseudomassariella vexata]|uniref:Extracellular membrane protein CFEM domain-containing protein n=1 Tax=Pseudomassariella vexata TaxID=1141098 RepID=A0A1Y2E2I7_9PEZI|nr:uncharacterized protein BCR38DRAFT_408829 [Pseudomassariella vexata]ORY65085.1 hypothetical protein BCR38DRAFT_408829 [Pseudomassariella vexata]
MKCVLFPIAIFAAAVSAQTTSSSGGSTACAALPILEACLSTTEGYVSQCTSTDYTCLCDKYTAIMTCFNNCPGDSRSSSYSNQKELYCMNASLYSSMTATAAATNSGSTVAAATTPLGTKSTGSTDGAQETDPTSSSTNSAAGATHTNGAAELISSASGLLAAVAGVLLAVL